MNSKTDKTIIFSDLDGTILNENYSFEDVRSEIARLIALNIPIVLCSSKTRAEIEYYRKKLSIHSPFISENGAAIFLPKGSFKIETAFTKQTGQFDIVELGITYSSIRKKFNEIKKTLADEIIGFGDMTAEEIAKDSGLPIELAKLAKQREYSEPFCYNGKQETELFSSIRKDGWRISKGGKYFNLSGDHDKGKAVLLLKELYSKRFENLRTVGVGNGPNDAEMLDAVDESFFIVQPEEMQRVWKKIICKVLNLSPLT